MSAARQPISAEQQQTALLQMMDQAGAVVSAMTGIRQQFIEQGWSPANAQEATLLLWRAALVSIGEQGAVPGGRP